jgi:hypothetical protein
VGSLILKLSGCRSLISASIVALSLSPSPLPSHSPSSSGCTCPCRPRRRCPTHHPLGSSSWRRHDRQTDLPARQNPSCVSCRRCPHPRQMRRRSRPTPGPNPMTHKRFMRQQPLCVCVCVCVFYHHSSQFTQHPEKRAEYRYSSPEHTGIPHIGHTIP